MLDLDGDDDLDEQVAYLAYLTKSGNRLLAEQAQDMLDRLATVEIVKVGPKGYIHGWIFVGAPGVGDAVHHPKHGRGVVSHHDEHGHVHVRFDSGERRSFEAVGTGDGKLRARSEVGNDVFTRHLKAAAAANRRGDHAAAAEHYRQAAQAASHPKIKKEMLARAERDAAKVKPTHAVALRPETHAAVHEAARQLPKTHDDWQNLFRRKVEGGPRRYIDQRVQQMQDDVNETQGHLDRARRELDFETEKIKRYLAAQGISPRTKRYKDAVASHLQSYQERIERLERDLRMNENFYQRTKEAADDPAKLEALMGPDAARHLAKELPPRYESTYPKDARDYRMPPAELKAHHERVMAAGKAIHADLMRAFETDPQLQDLRRQHAALHDAEGFTAGETMKEKIANKRMITRLEIEQRRRQKELIHDALGQVRPFGGIGHADAHESTDADIAKMPKSWRDGGMAPQRARADWRDQLAAGEQHFPKDWLATSSHKPLDVIASPRAFHIEGYGRPGATVLAMNTDIAADLAGYNGGFESKVHEITVHEMGHRMEVVIPGLTALEFAYVRSRTTDAHGNVEMPQKLKDLYGGSYGDREVAFKDEFPNAYTGKTYERGKDEDPASQHWEAFQVGLQDVYGRSTTNYGDESLQHFVLGVLATLHRMEAS